MKHFKTLTLGSALLFGASTVTAQTTTSEGPNDMVGSDTLNAVMDDLLPALGITVDGAGIDNYAGLGSSSGERQIEGSPNADEPFCQPNDPNGAPEANPGCQEISPMSRQMDSSICEDDNASTNAEGLAVCRDGLVIVTSNASLGMYGDDAASCAAFNALADTDNTGTPPVFPDNGVGNMRSSGTLPNTGYVIGGGTLAGTGEEWTDVPRLIFTGCQNDDGACAAADDRVARCGSDIRRELVASWDLMFEGTDCGTDTCTTGSPDGGLRFAFRRDDNSGTTGVFLELLGVAVNLGSRQSIVSFGVPIAATAMPPRLAFCDGGMTEGYFPTNYADPALPTTDPNFYPQAVPRFDRGDPIRKPCAPEDDLCAFDGRLGLVRPVISTGSFSYPDYQCGAVFELKQFINTPRRVCPDGSQPFGGACWRPFYQSGAFKTFDCLNDAASRASTVPTTVDGRSYNYVQVDQNGATQFIIPGSLPVVPQWRMNAAELDTGFAGAFGFQFNTGKGDHVCIEADATRNIGCFVGQSDCTMGYAGREAAYSTATNDTLFNEPVLLDGQPPSDAAIAGGTYPFARELWINALNGFENMSADCAARGESPQYCADQLAIANAFFNVGQPGNPVAGICQAAGYIGRSAPLCVGTQASAGCGRPVAQAVADCTPQ